MPLFRKIQANATITIKTTSSRSDTDLLLNLEREFNTLSSRRGLSSLFSVEIHIDKIKTRGVPIVKQKAFFLVQIEDGDPFIVENMASVDPALEHLLGLGKRHPNPGSSTNAWVWELDESYSSEEVEEINLWITPIDQLLTE